MAEPLIFDQFPQEMKDLAPIATALVRECFQGVSEIEIQSGESREGLPEIVLKVLVDEDVHQAAKDYIVYQERWREASPEIYRQTIRLVYDIVE